MLAVSTVVPISQEKSDKVISLKYCHTELGLELAEHRDSRESTVSTDGWSLQQPRRWPFLGLQTVFPRWDANPCEA